jgi:rhodanese-related sulfurtransferase
VSQSPDDLLAQARQRIGRVEPDELQGVAEAGGLIIDIRPAAQRADEGELAGAVVIERNVLEWRLDPSGDHRIPEVTDHDRTVVVVCSQGYASSLAADSLRQLGYRNVADLAGGYLAWLEWAADTGAGPAG